MTNVYSLADYSLIVKLPEDLGLGYTELTLGGPGESGEGSMTGSIVVAYTTERWKTDGDYTGSYVHTLNLDRTGTIALDIRQVSDKVLRLHQLMYAYESVQNRPNKGLLILVKSNNNSLDETLYTAQDCRITKMPNQDFGTEVKDQTWTFTCGRILPNMSVFNN